jgi:hemerythrin-like metal-binding protein
MPIEWNDDLKTGVHILDEQHQELVVMLTRLGRFKCGERSYQDALNELQDYVDNHFKAEEDYMCRLKYPEYDDHKSCHDKFVEAFKRIQNKMNCADNICDVGEELFDFVQDWLLFHYANEDVRLADYVKKVS